MSQRSTGPSTASTASTSSVSCRSCSGGSRRRYVEVGSLRRSRPCWPSRSRAGLTPGVRPPSNSSPALVSVLRLRCGALRRGRRAGHRAISARRATASRPLQCPAMERTDAEARRAANARLVANLRRAAEAESAERRAAEWRNASLERHAQVLIEVCGVAELINRSRPRPYVKPPLDYPRVPGRPSRWSHQP